MDPFLGEIRMFAGNYAPQDWHLCDGSVLNINSNQALFSLIGTTYGGDGINNFCLPDLRGRAPIHIGQGAGLSMYSLGQKIGAERVTPTIAQTPAHTHTLSASSATSNDSFDGPFTFGTATGNGNALAYAAAGGDAPLAADVISSSDGGNQAHNNVQPFLVVNYIMSIAGLYPERA